MTQSDQSEIPSSGKKVALVTGGSGGIGQAISKRLAREGAAVVAAYAGRPAAAEVLVKDIMDAGGQAMAVRADVAEEADVAALFDAAEHAFGGVDVVVNTAGIMLLASLTELDLADLDRMHRINIRGTFVVSREAARRVRSGGAIINFSSSVVKIAFPTYTAYAATKGAVDAMTLILAKELRGKDITVNAVAPGPTATPLFLDGKSQEAIDHLAQMAPLQRLGVPDDVAEVVAFLAGPARWVNGQVLYANGGVARGRHASSGHSPRKEHSMDIIITGASSGFGAMTARALADAGHSVWAGMRDIGGRNKKAARQRVSDRRVPAIGHAVTLRHLDARSAWPVTLSPKWPDGFLASSRRPAYPAGNACRHWPVLALRSS